MGLDIVPGVKHCLATSQNLIFEPSFTINDPNGKKLFRHH
jgi:hypothetical protein